MASGDPPHPDPEVQERLDALDAGRSGDAAQHKKHEATEAAAGRRGVRNPLRYRAEDDSPSRPGPFSSMLDEFSKLFILSLVVTSLLLGFAISALRLVPTPG